MKISELVKLLSEVQEKSGDRDVYVVDTFEGGELPLAGISLSMGEQGEVISVLLCDQDTLDAFDNCDSGE